MGYILGILIGIFFIASGCLLYCFYGFVFDVFDRVDRNAVHKQKGTCEIRRPD